MTTSDVAAALDLKYQMALDLVTGDDFPAVKQGQWRVSEEAFEAWVQEQYAATRTYVEELGDPDASPAMWEHRQSVNRGRPRLKGH